MSAPSRAWQELLDAARFALDECVDLIATEEGERLQAAVDRIEDEQ